MADNKFFFEKVGGICYNALISEVTSTPKPGLVDSANNGAHRDMDVNTFKKSALALRPYFVSFAEYGYDTRLEPISSVLPMGRKIGMEAEKAMLSATGGVNTHKGIIFSAGLICMALGRLYGLGLGFGADGVCRFVADTVSGISSSDYSDRVLQSKQKLSNGEKIYKQYGLRGPRGEAESGFTSVRRYGLPFYKECKICGMDDNEAQVRTLLNLMSNIDDTNVINRGGMEASVYVKSRATLIRDAAFDEIRLFDLDLIERNLSPGGCADLLAVTLILHDAEHLNET